MIFLKHWKLISIALLVIGAFYGGYQFKGGIEAKAKLKLIAKYKKAEAEQDAKYRALEKDLLIAKDKRNVVVNETVVRVPTYIKGDCTISKDGINDINKVLRNE